MADMQGGFEKLPPKERLKRLKALEEEKRQILEEELEKKRKEIEALASEAEKGLENAEEMEEEARREIEEEDLDARVKEFSQSKSFIPEGKEEQETLYQSAPGGFGQQQSMQEEAIGGIDYLLHGQNIAVEQKAATERNIYQNVRQMREQLNAGDSGEESYAFNQLQEQVLELKEKGNDDFGYIARIENVLNDIIDYKQQDEKRRKG
jgi:hypothetical protein